MKIEITVLDEIQDDFFKALEAKSGWGKNDVKDVYKDVVLEVLKKNIQNIKS